MKCWLESRDGWHRATVEEGDGGIAVVILARMAPWREIHRAVIDAPFHVVRDGMIDVLNTLAPPQNTMQPRDGVRSINGVSTK